MKKYISEFIGTFSLVFCGTGAIIINEVSNGGVTHLGIALSFGIIVAAMIYALGDISGAHLNPAVTLGFGLEGTFSKKQILPYILSQVLGAVSASFLLKLLFPSNINLGATLPAGSDMQSFILEIILTFILMFVIIRVATGSKETGIMAGIAISGVVAMEAAFAGPICGASMNPARSLAPALASGNMNSLWIYLIAPPIGAVLAVLTHKLLNDLK